MRLVNSGSEFGFRRAETLRANIVTSPLRAGFRAYDGSSPHDAVYISSAFQRPNVTYEEAALFEVIGVCTQNPHFGHFE
jgi:hypothetical protein